MKLKTLICAALILTTTNIGTAHATENWRDTECRYQYLDGHRGWSTWEVKRTIWCATKKWGVSTSTALYVADRESHFGQYATNRYSGACGVYQHMPAYWPGRITTLDGQRPSLRPLGTSCYNARSNVMAAIWMARGGWSAWSQ